jgi:hypothetical protein
MKVSELQTMLRKYKREYGDVDLGIKMSGEGMEHIYIREIAGISMCGFEGHNICDGNDEG